MAEPKVTPISEGLISRVSRGVRYVITGVGGDNFFGPNQPIEPIAQDRARGRAFDYPTAYNLRLNPKQQDEGVSFSQLRSLADAYPLLRLVIETRKDQIEKMDWMIKPRDKPGVKLTPQEIAADPRVQKITDWLRYPDGYTDYARFLRAMLEDVFVIDALTLYPRFTRGGEFAALEIIDGATIKPLLDVTGRAPAAPSPAFQQVIKGLPAVDYTRDELLYCPRNVRSNRVYGFSPVEQLILTINIGLRKEYSELAHFTEGNIPEAFMGVPDTWTPKQIAEFQETFDAMMAGNLLQKSRVKFVPGQIAKAYVPTKNDTIAEEFYSEWLARHVCFAFSIPPTNFVKGNNRAVSEALAKQSKEEGLQPIMRFLKERFDFIIAKCFGMADLEFAWREQDQIDIVQQAQAISVYVGAGVMNRNEARDELGLEPIEGGEEYTIAGSVMTLEQGTMTLDEKNAAALDHATNMSDALPDPVVGPGGPPKPGEKKPEPKPTDKKEVGKSATIPFDLAKATTLSNTSRTVTHAVDRLAAKIRKSFRAAAKHIADHLHTQAVLTVHKADDEFAFEINVGDFGQLDSQIGGEAQAIYTASSKAAAQQLNLGFDMHLVSERAVAWAYSRSGELVTDIADTTRDLIRQDVVRALGDPQGYSADSLAQTLQENYAFSQARAEMIARTELAFANSQGALDQYKESGVVGGKQWILGPDPCPECQANADEGVIGIDESFGSGDQAPPAHPNCVCDVVPILSDDMTD